jgi:heme-degrading monooxygenase HmoA
VEVVLFHIQTRENLVVDDYERAFEEMLTYVSEMPGFVSIEPFTGEDGSELAVARFESRAAIEAWRIHPEHLRTQQRGRQEFFARFRISIATVWKQYTWSEAEGRHIEISP